jgi:hypothetical protein
MRLRVVTAGSLFATAVVSFITLGLNLDANPNSFLLPLAFIGSIGFIIGGLFVLIEEVTPRKLTARLSGVSPESDDVLLADSARINSRLLDAEVTARSLTSSLSGDLLRSIGMLRWKLAILDRDETELISMDRTQMTSAAFDQRMHALHDIRSASATLSDEGEELCEAVLAAFEAELDSKSSLKVISAASARARELTAPNPDDNTRELLASYTDTLRALTATDSDIRALQAD